ncbi:unnamed protein product [Rotaria sp. Silwood1]|nr:unnamed protein product [Rotaria sp. Silwood1]
MKKVFYHASNNEPYSIAFIDSLSIYFDTIQNYVELTCQFSTGDIHDKASFLSCETDQIMSCCTLSRTVLSIIEYLYQRHGLTISNIL